jgi:hypothetical protein
VRHKSDVGPRNEQVRFTPDNKRQIVAIEEKKNQTSAFPPKARAALIKADNSHRSAIASAE